MIKILFHQVSRLMTTSSLTFLVTLMLATAGLPISRAQTIIISEFMASNGETTIDDEDNRSDWIELHNPGFSAINLEGWALTDDPTHTDIWTFPSITLFPNSYLVVFASNKDRKAPGAPLHTSFNLNRKGEYLALLDPDGNPSTEFAPAYPEQTTDVSYGRGVVKADEIVIIPNRAPAKAMIPANGTLGRSWTQPDFDDGDWKSGRTGIGYDYQGLINLDVRNMRGENETVYARIPFAFEENTNLDTLILRIRYDDGFIAYLNGTAIARDNAPSNPDWQSAATLNRSDNIAVNAVDVNISSAIDLLETGENVLAIHGLNQGINSSDILILPELIAQLQSDAPETFGFMLAPSPGLPNNDSIQGITPSVEFSVASQVFDEPFSLELSLPQETLPGTEIRYTEDGTRPNSSSNLYTTPLEVSETIQIRAISVLPSKGQSTVTSESYTGLNAQTRGFNSNLPVVVLENYQGGRPPQNSKQASFMMLYEPNEEFGRVPSEGRTRFNQAPTISTRSGIKVRGSSTSGRPKPSMSMEAWDEFDQNKNIALLGMPSESDWVLWGPYNFDLSLMHNPFIYELSNQIGRYATHTRFVEVFLNTDGGPLDSNDYYGVYALMEKISRDQDRVDVARIFPEHNQEPGVTGGYIFKIDRADPGDSGFGGAGQSIRYVYPKEVDIERPERNDQESYIRSFFQEMNRRLRGSSLTDGEEGYAGLIDVDAAIDHHLLNVLAFNVDALRLSGYFHKPRGGKLTFGPIWDFDRALGSTDGRDRNPRTWRSTSGDRGTDFFNYPWWRDMFRDLDFFQLYIDRYQMFRRSEFSTRNINAVIDSMADELREAQKRNLSRWNQRPRGSNGGTYQGEIDYMKDWLEDRMEFMDGEFVDAPLVGVSSLGESKVVSLTSRDGGVIYYTTDGTDPRLPGGNPSRKASIYKSKIEFSTSTTITARVFNENHQSRTGSNNPPLSSLWSGPSTRLISLSVPPRAGELIVSEIQYNPQSANKEELLLNPSFRNEDFEFIELKNVSNSTLELAGTEFSSGIRFRFPINESWALPAGTYITIAKNLDAFSARYPSYEGYLAGPFNGNLSNGGETLSIQNSTGSTLTEFRYEDNWYPATDGDGFSLVVANADGSGADGATQEAWRQGSVLHGTPGTKDAGHISVSLESIQIVDDSVSIAFQSEAGITYIMEYTTALAGADWQTLRLIPASAESAIISVTDQNPKDQTRFYRLNLVTE